MRKFVILLVLVLISANVFAGCDFNLFGADSIVIGEDTQIYFSCTTTRDINIIVSDFENTELYNQSVICQTSRTGFEEPFNGSSGIANVTLVDGCTKQVYFSVESKKEESIIPDNNFIVVLFVFMFVSIIIVKKKK